MESNRNRCRHTEGILLRRKRCPETFMATCHQCQKPLCRKHIRNLDDQYYCIDCINGTQGRNYNESYYDPEHGRYRYSPYGYSHQYYHGWGNYGSKYESELGEEAKASVDLEETTGVEDSENPSLPAEPSSGLVEGATNGDHEPELQAEIDEDSFPEDFEDGDGESFEDAVTTDFDAGESDEFENDMDAS